MIPEDRLREGLCLEWTLEENFLLGLQDRKPFQRERNDRVRSASGENRGGDSRVRYASRPLDAIAGRLSGGNQQKLIIAREFESKPRFLIAAQPTRGVDVGAIEFIHERILRARNEGTGVLLVSSELDEVLALSDRVLVMYAGAIVGEFARTGGQEFDEKRIGLSHGRRLRGGALMTMSISLRRFLGAIQPVLAVLLGLLLGVMVAWVAGENPFNVLKILFVSAFGSRYDFGMTLFYSTPLVLTGLAVAIPFQAGLFNIGAEGQLVVGALSAAAVGALFPHVPWPLAPLLAILAAFVGGRNLGRDSGLSSRQARKP